MRFSIKPALIGQKFCHVGDTIAIKAIGVDETFAVGALEDGDIRLVRSVDSDDLFILFTAHSPGVYDLSVSSLNGDLCTHTIHVAGYNNTSAVPHDEAPPGTVLVICETKDRTPEEAAVLYDAGLLQYFSANGFDRLYLDKDEFPEWAAPYVEQAKQYGLPHVLVLYRGKLVANFPLPDNVTAFIKNMEDLRDVDVPPC